MVKEPLSASRFIRHGKMFLETEEATVRSVSAKSGISRSTIHLDITARLREIDPELYEEVQRKLTHNWNAKYARGGEATKRKYKSPI